MDTFLEFYDLPCGCQMRVTRTDTAIVSRQMTAFCSDEHKQQPVPEVHLTFVEHISLERVNTEIVNIPPSRIRRES